jgi:hypothetical protein
MKKVSIILKNMQGIMVRTSYLSDNSLISDLWGLTDDLDAFEYAGPGNGRKNIKLDFLHAWGDMKNAMRIKSQA